MQRNDNHTTGNHDQVHNQMSAAGLQGFTVQRLVLTGQTDDCNLCVSENHGAYRRGEQDDSEREAVHIINKHTVTGEFKQRGIVTVRIHDHRPASVQPYGQTEKNPDQNKGHSPGRNCQLDHHFVGHYGSIAQRITDGHISVKGHNHEHSETGGIEHVCNESLNYTLKITDETFGRRPQEI